MIQWGVLYASGNSPVYFIRHQTDEESCNDTGNKQGGGIVKETGVFHNEYGYQKLSNIVADAACNADSDKAEALLFF